MSQSDKAILHAMLTQPHVLDEVAENAMIDLMVDLAEGRLSGEDLELARQLRDSDAEAREIYRLYTSLPETVAAPAPWRRALEELAVGLDEVIRAIYWPAAQNTLRGDGGSKQIPNEQIVVQNVTCTLQRARLPDGRFEIAIVVPARAHLPRASLNQLQIRLVDETLVFEETDSGDLVASCILPAAVADPTKRIVVVQTAPPPSPS